MSQSPDMCEHLSMRVGKAHKDVGMIASFMIISCASILLTVRLSLRRKANVF